MPQQTALPPHRAAALAAAEARLREPPPEGQGSSPIKPKDAVWVQPSEKDDRDSRKELSRLLDRGIVRDNGYKQAAECIETLLKISTNIQQNDREAKYRTLKATNVTLKNKVLGAKGGHEYLIALGFRTQTIDFTAHYVLQPSMRRMHQLKLGCQVLSDHLANVQSRAAQSASSKGLHQSDEAARKARALREIEADRESVRDRADREKLGREMKAKKEQERLAQEAEAAAAEEDERQVEGGAALLPLDAATTAHLGSGDGAAHATEERDEEEDSDGTYDDWGGRGRRLGQ